MTVTSVGTNSFQAQVWGISFTVNWSGSLASPFEFWFRSRQANATSTPAAQLAVGDEVGVSGILVASSSPLTVNANVVRDYSITMPRPVFQPHGDNGYGNSGMNDGKGNGNGNNENGNGNTGSNSSDTQGRFNDLMKQFQNLQNLFRNRFGNFH